MNKQLVSIAIILACIAFVQLSPQAKGRWHIRAWLIFLMAVAVGSVVWSWL